MTPLESYQHRLTCDDFVNDPAQARAVDLLQAIFEALTQQRPESGFISRLISGGNKRVSVKGLYLWGGVGRGKTLLMDDFFSCLPMEEKKRIHFHRFMSQVHSELKHLRHVEDPLFHVAEKFSKQFRVLCFDEFIVNDIADAMILGGLLQHLFDRGVTLVATSNIHPDNLYRDGLQRDRFQPAIDLIKLNTTVFEMTGHTDYRLEFMSAATTYFHPHNELALAGLEANFDKVAPDSGQRNAAIDIGGREVMALRVAGSIAWFEFREICGGPRAQNEYLTLSRWFNTLVVSDIPILSTESDDEARRFVNLIDILYDRNVKFMGSGACPPQELYQGSRLAQEFQRTVSRIIEMQSPRYLGREHLA